MHFQLFRSLCANRTINAIAFGRNAFPNTFAQLTWREFFCWMSEQERNVMQALDVLQGKTVPLIDNFPDLALLAKNVLFCNICSVALSDNSTKRDIDVHTVLLWYLEQGYKIFYPILPWCRDHDGHLRWRWGAIVLFLPRELIG